MTNTMLFRTYLVLALAVPIFSQENAGGINNGGSSSGCAMSVDQIMHRVRQCQLNISGSNFIEGDNVRGYKIIETMTELCRQYPRGEQCVADIAVICPQLTRLDPEKIKNRLCTDRHLASWYLTAIRGNLETSQSCINQILGGAINNCSNAHDVYAEPMDMSTVHGRWSYNIRVASSIYTCALENLTSHISNFPGCGVSAQDMMVILYTIITAENQFEYAPSDEVFASVQKFVSLSSN